MIANTVEIKTAEQFGKNLFKSNIHKARIAEAILSNPKTLERTLERGKIKDVCKNLADGYVSKTATERTDDYQALLDALNVEKYSSKTKQIDYFEANSDRIKEIERCEDIEDGEPISYISSRGLLRAAKYEKTCTEANIYAKDFSADEMPAYEVIDRIKAVSKELNLVEKSKKLTARNKLFLEKGIIPSQIDKEADNATLNEIKALNYEQKLRFFNPDKIKANLIGLAERFTYIAENPQKTGHKMYELPTDVVKGIKNIQSHSNLSPNGIVNSSSNLVKSYTEEVLEKPLIKEKLSEFISAVDIAKENKMPIPKNKLIKQIQTSAHKMSAPEVVGTATEITEKEKTKKGFFAKLKDSLRNIVF